jgi:hypothetical protein
MQAHDGRRTCSPNVADPKRTNRALPDWLEQQERPALRVWGGLAEPPVRQIRLVPQRRTERSAAKEELVRQDRKRKARAALEEWAHPGRQPEQSEHRIRTRRSPAAEQTQSAISWTNPPSYIDEQDLHRFDKFRTNAGQKTEHRRQANRCLLLIAFEEVGFSLI